MILVTFSAFPFCHLVGTTQPQKGVPDTYLFIRKAKGLLETPRGFSFSLLARTGQHGMLSCKQLGYTGKTVMVALAQLRSIGCSWAHCLSYQLGKEGGTGNNKMKIKNYKLLNWLFDNSVSPTAFLIYSYSDHVKISTLNLEGTESSLHSCLYFPFTKLLRAHAGIWHCLLVHVDYFTIFIGSVSLAAASIVALSDPPTQNPLQNHMVLNSPDSGVGIYVREILMSEIT